MCDSCEHACVYECEEYGEDGPYIDNWALIAAGAIPFVMLLIYILFN